VRPRSASYRLLTPDSALLVGSDKVNVPLAGPVSFVGFIIIGPAVLVVLRVYLEIYIEHGKRLTGVAWLVQAKRDPTLLSSHNAFLRIAFALVLALFLPLTLFMFAWKAAVFPAWGAGLLCVAAAVTAGHAMLPLRRVSWRARVLLSVSVAILAGAILAGGAMFGLGLPRRSFDLFRANLSGQWLVSDDLNGANLGFTNLNHAVLSGAKLWVADMRSADLRAADLIAAELGFANLNHADLRDANLRGADLGGADLSGANMRGADLRDANLGGADLDGTDLSGANLSSVYNLTQPQLDQACGTAELPPGLALKPCPEGRTAAP
jgi:uncharacterized protein YjbI with pentapeptide repeats